MKGKLFKKVIASVSAVSMLGSMAFAIPASADETQGISYADGIVTVVADTETATLIYAQYDGDILTDVSLYPLTFTDGVATQALADAANGSKLMVWNAIDGEGSMVPLADTYTVTGGTDTTEKPATEVPATEAPTPTQTVEPTATPTPEATIDPDLIYYTYDHESDVSIDTAGNSWNTALETWVSYYDASGQSVQTDSNPAINKYYQFKNDSGSGTRSAYFIMPEAAATLDENQQSVIEFDFKLSTTGADSELVIVGNPTPSASNTPGNSFYTGTNYILKLYQSASLNGFYVNDNQTILSTGYPNTGEWAHAKAVLSYESRSVLLTVTSLDGAATYLATTQVPMGATAGAPRIIFVAGGRNGGAAEAIDNFMSRKVTDGDIDGVYYTATFVVDGAETKLSAKEGEKIDAAGIPATEKTGYVFDGWAKDGDTENLLSTEAVADTPLTADVTYTAVYHEDSAYIEPMVSLEFSTFPANGLPTAGADENTAASNPIQVKLIGELGNDLLAEPDERVTDLDVKWEFDGFRTVVSKNAPTTDINDDEYCDSYAKVVKDENDPTKVDFQLKSQAFNFYGQVKVTVTYNGDTLTITKPMSILPDKTAEQGVILPKAGYVSDFNLYEDTMVGYQATTSGDNKSATDIVTGDWAAYGGNSGRGLYIAEDNGKKFLKLKSTGTNSSSFAVNKLDAAPTGQVIISQDVRFYNNNSGILFKTDNPVTWSNNATTLSLNFTGTALTMNGGTKVADAAPGVWYHIVLSCDVTSKLWYAKVYDMDGQLLGEADAEAFVNAGSTSPTYLCYRTPDNANGELDFNNVRMYTPNIDSELTTTIENETLSIPEEGEAAATTTLTVTAKSDEGYDIIGAATWSIVDEPDGVTITPDADNSHRATLSVANGAAPGDITVRVAMGGKTKDITVTLTSSKDSVKFTQQTRSISIPLTAGASDEYTYAAAVVDKDGSAIAGKTVTYAMYDKNNTNEITSLKGVTFNKDTATLTVTSEAEAATVYIRATGTNTDGDTISSAVKVTIHGLSFDFGTDADGAVAEGYTAVAPGTAYSDSTGYGISSGTATAGGTASDEDADTDSLTGTFTFQAKVEPAKVYNVTINYSGSVASEYVNSDLSGVALANETKSSVTYVVPVIDDVLDLAFSGATVSSIVIEKQAEKAAGAKPNIYTVGDSTIANNGSWAYVLARDVANYPDLTALASFSNNGRGGKNLSTYYTGGEFRDRVLSQVRPGDYVMIGDMGTNGMGSTFEADFNYYIDACEALGAKVILNSYSPHGAVGDYVSGYDASTHTFTSYRQDSYDNIVRAIYAERSDVSSDKYDENIVGFVDIGKMADAAFNAYVAAADDQDAAAQEIISCFSDHNHYSNGTRACQLMIEGYGDGADAKGIVKTLVEIITADLN